MVYVVQHNDDDKMNGMEKECQAKTESKFNYTILVDFKNKDITIMVITITTFVIMKVAWYGNHVYSISN